MLEKKISSNNGDMNRRSFIKTSAIGGVAFALQNLLPQLQAQVVSDIPVLTPQEAVYKIIYARNSSADGEDNRKIWVVDEDGKNQTLLTENNSDNFSPIWTPYNNVAFVRLTYNPQDTGLDRQSIEDIAVIRGVGAVGQKSGEIRIESIIKEAGHSYRDLSYSLDGKLAFSSYPQVWLPPIYNHIHIMFPDGSVFELKEDYIGEMIKQPRISPDGKRIAFLSRDENSKKDELHIADIYTGKRRRIVTPPDVIYELAWNPDNETITISGGAEPKSIRTIYRIKVDVQTTESNAHPDYRHTEMLYSSIIKPIQGLSWKHDGTQLAFSAYTSDKDTKGSMEIYVINRDGTGLKKLTGYDENGGGLESEIRYFDDETPVQGSELVLEDSRNPTWRPDGKRIAFVHNGFDIEKISEGGYLLTPYQDIFTMNPDGTGKKRITTDRLPKSDLSYSPIEFYRENH